jgi:ABC-type transporter MlaC component
MIKRKNKKIIYAGGLSLTALLIIVLYLMNNTYDSSANSQNKSTAHKTFEQLKAECDQKYNEDLKKGIRYIAYPCEDKTIQARYEKQ